MDTQVLNRLNRRLADALGTNGNGEGRHKWAHTRDITLIWRKDSEFKQSASGLWTPDAQYETIRQEDEDYWTIAVWDSPPSPDVWLTLYGSDIPYPRGGMWFVSSVRLPEGVEPTDAHTDAVIGAVRYRNERVRTFRDAMNRINEKQAEIARRRDALYDDWIKDQFTAGFNVPGSRGYHASFPAVQKASGAKETA